MFEINLPHPAEFRHHKWEATMLADKILWRTAIWPIAELVVFHILQDRAVVSSRRPQADRQ